MTTSTQASAQPATAPWPRRPALAIVNLAAELLVLAGAWSGAALRRLVQAFAAPAKGR